MFDRLASDLPAQDSGMLDTMETLEESIGRELHRMFNTRSNLGLAAYLRAEGTVLDYGLPNFSFLSGQSATDLESLQKALEVAIRRFEPRLLDPSVRVSPSRDKNGMGVVQVTTSTRLGSEIRRIEFELAHEIASGVRNTQ